jgi:hypothetical protein
MRRKCKRGVGVKSEDMDMSNNEVITEVEEEEAEEEEVEEGVVVEEEAARVIGSVQSVVITVLLEKILAIDVGHQSLEEDGVILKEDIDRVMAIGGALAEIIVLDGETLVIDAGKQSLEAEINPDGLIIMIEDTGLAWTEETEAVLRHEVGTRTDTEIECKIKYVGIDNIMVAN